MEFEPISAEAPLLDKHGWYRSDITWDDAALQQPMLKKATGSIASESSCSCTDVGSPTGGGPKEATAWDSLCTEWNSDKIVVTGPEENANPSMRQDALATPTYELFVDAEQRGLWCALIVHRTSSMLM